MVKFVESLGRWAIQNNIETIIIGGMVCLIAGFLISDFIENK